MSNFSVVVRSFKEISNGGNFTQNFRIRQHTNSSKHKFLTRSVDSIELEDEALSWFSRLVCQTLCQRLSLGILSNLF